MVSSSTLYLEKGYGLEVARKIFDNNKKTCSYRYLERPLANAIKEHEQFEKLFKRYSGKSEGGRYPFLDVRKLMWDLRMKPIKKDIFEYYF